MNQRFKQVLSCTHRLAALLRAMPGWNASSGNSRRLQHLRHLASRVCARQQHAAYVRSGPRHYSVWSHGWLSNHLCIRPQWDLRTLLEVCERRGPEELLALRVGGTGVCGRLVPRDACLLHDGTSMWAAQSPKWAKYETFADTTERKSCTKPPRRYNLLE